MTVIRTDIIPNLYANPIVSISQDDPAVMTVPVVETIVSATGTIGTVTGSGTAGTPWTATITNMTSVAGLISGQPITATAGTGDFAAGGVVSVQSVLGNQSIQINKIGGTIPTAGTVTDISLPEKSTFPLGVTDGDPILFTNPGNKFTFTTTGSFQANEIITQATSGATGIVTNTVAAISSASIVGSVGYIATSGVFDTTHTVTGSQSGFAAIPTAVTGMNELLTAGAGGSNEFFVKELTPTTYELYTDTGLTTSVDSSGFTAYTPNAGQYTTFDSVEITTP
jgi:hypothetical protein